MMPVSFILIPLVKGSEDRRFLNSSVLLKILLLIMLNDKKAEIPIQ